MGEDAPQVIPDSPRAGFGLRVLAQTVDLIIACVMMSPLLRLLPDSSPPSSFAIYDGGMGVILAQIGWVKIGMAFVLPIIAATFFEWSRWHATPGKLLLGLKVERERNEEEYEPQQDLTLLRSLVRQCAKIISLLPLGIGFLLAIGSTKRALHDKMTGTRVVKSEERRV